MKGLVDRVAKGVELDQDKGCAATVATNNRSSHANEQPPRLKTLERIKSAYLRQAKTNYQAVNLRSADAGKGTSLSPRE